MMRALWWLLACCLVTPAAAREATLDVELNRLDEAGGGCSVYFVLENGTGREFQDLSLDLVMFDAQGVVASRLAVQFAPLPAAKTALRVFEVPDMSCGAMSRILVNDVVGCRDSGGDEGGCLDSMRLSSRSDVAFIK